MICGPSPIFDWAWLGSTEPYLGFFTAVFFLQGFHGMTSLGHEG